MSNCNKIFTNKNKHLDHDHKTGCARGYLCNGCNRGLGMLGDSIEGLTKAINYLKNPIAKEFVNEQLVIDTNAND